MNSGELVPMKLVAGALGVSRQTLWRASRSSIPGFPPPTIVRRRVYWQRLELAALEAAMLRYEGRQRFEVNRVRARRVAAISALAKSATRGARPSRARDRDQPNLFEE